MLSTIRNRVQVDSAPVTRLTMTSVDLQRARQGHTTERHHILRQQAARRLQCGPAADQPDPTIGISGTLSENLQWVETFRFGNANKAGNSLGTKFKFLST